MKTILSAALVAILFAGTALAQPPDRGGDRGQRGGGGDRPQMQDRGPANRGGGDRGPADWGGRGGNRQDRVGPQQAPQAPQAQPAPQAPQAQFQRDDRRGPDNRIPNRGFDNRDRDNRGPDNRGSDNGFDNRGQPNRGFDNRGFDNRGSVYRGPAQQQFRDRDRGRPQFDQRQFRPAYRAPQRFRAAPYRAPPGFFARSWSYGDRLPWGWFGSSYYLNWGSYGLPLPPIGCEWVRVGSDALLVDIWSGEVLSVYYGLFW